MSTSVTHIQVGDRVETKDNYRGTCQYVGPVKGLNTVSVGVFVGIELDECIDEGHDGSTAGVQYFNCNNGHGVFITIEECIKIDSIRNDDENIRNEDSNDDDEDEDEDEDEDSNDDLILIEESDKDNIIDDSDEMSNNNNGIISNVIANNINCSELDPEEASKALSRKLQARTSQFEIERQGIVPPNYFSDPFATTKNIDYEHEMVSHSLAQWLPSRLQQQELEMLNIVPPNYFQDPSASIKGKSLVKEMISNNLEDFHHRRPTLDELQMKNIYHSVDDNKKEQEKRNEISKELNEKLSHNKRPTITDLGDMHIIPHDYLDNLLEDAVANHQRKESRMEHVQERLEKHLPEPVAATLAETLLTSVHDTDTDNNIINNINNNNNDDDDDEWQISFVYEPMQNFVPMNPAQKDEVTNKLERRLSLRPSKQQIEVWGFVPPQYFESPEQSFLRQALGREIALDLLEGFFPHREDIYDLTNRGIMHPDFIGRDHSEAVREQHARKKSVMDELNTKLDPSKRPSIIELSDKGLIPENWLLDLYGLADKVRKRHKKMDSAVLDLKSQLNVPPVLADVVARDVLDEIETVDPYLDDGGGHDNDDNDDNNDIIAELNERLCSLSQRNDRLESEINGMRDKENKQLNKILSLEKKTSLIVDQTKEIKRLRQEQNSTELSRLDAKAIEIELSKERSHTQRLRNDKSQLETKLFNANYKLSQMELILQEFANEKIQLLKKTNEQINQLRNYIKHYQKYFNSIQQQQQKNNNNNNNSNNNNLFTNIFG